MQCHSPSVSIPYRPLNSDTGRAWEWRRKARSSTSPPPLAQHVVDPAANSIASSEIIIALPSAAILEAHISRHLEDMWGRLRMKDKNN
jgi:hypothetical protein